MSQRTRIKICGVRTVEHALVAAEAGADAVGLVFVERSPRVVTVEQAAKIVMALPPFVEPVGLFVDEPATEVVRIAHAVGLRTVQLHGREGPAGVHQLAPLRVLKSIGFDPGHILEKLQAWRGPAQNLMGLLYDAATPRDGLPGGTGETLPWAELAALRDHGELDGIPPMVLAGGLTPGNVGEAVRTVQPYAVDVSSGVESSRGEKDADRIRAFCAAVHVADAAA